MPAWEAKILILTEMSFIIQGDLRLTLKSEPVTELQIDGGARFEQMLRFRVVDAPFFYEHIFLRAHFLRAAGIYRLASIPGSFPSTRIRDLHWLVSTTD